MLIKNIDDVYKAHEWISPVTHDNTNGLWEWGGGQVEPLSGIKYSCI